jgi:hypothetical protein
VSFKFSTDLGPIDAGVRVDVLEYEGDMRRMLDSHLGLLDLKLASRASGVSGTHRVLVYVSLFHLQIDNMDVAYVPSRPPKLFIARILTAFGHILERGHWKWSREQWDWIHGKLDSFILFNVSKTIPKTLCRSFRLLSSRLFSGRGLRRCTRSDCPRIASLRTVRKT